jgi:quinol monooxygenase YgiN
MPIVMVSHAPSRDLYERVAAEAHINTERPDGLIVHTASETADGTVRIVDLWESQAHVDEFERTHLIPAFEAVGALAGPPQREITEPFNIIR